MPIDSKTPPSDPAVRSLLGMGPEPQPSQGLIDLFAGQSAHARYAKLVEQAWRDGYENGRGIGRLDSDVDSAWDRSVAKRLLAELETP